MEAWVWRRGWRSHRQDSSEQFAGSSERPYTVVRMPAMGYTVVEIVRREKA